MIIIIISWNLHGVRKDQEMIFLFFCSSDFQFPVHGPIPIPLVTSSYSVHQPAMVPHLQQFLTHPIQEPTFQIFQRAPSPLVTCAPNLQPHFTHYGGISSSSLHVVVTWPPYQWRGVWWCILYHLLQLHVCSLVSRPCPAFRRFQYGKVGEGLISFLTWVTSG